MAAPLAPAVTAPPADPDCQVPVYCKKVSTSRLETDDEHQATCATPASCKRCGFWFAFAGAQFGKRGQLLPPLESKAFKRRFSFYDPLCGKRLPWMCMRPSAWGGPWAWGCVACNRAGDSSTIYGRIECRDKVSSSACTIHAGTKVHQDSVAALQKPQGKADDVREILAVSAIDMSEYIPRLDRWVKAASLIENFSSFRDYRRLVNATGVGNMYDSQDKGAVNDSSPRVSMQAIIAMAAPYTWRDYEVLSKASTTSIGCDERDGLLLVGARTMVRSTSEIYDCLLGSVRHLGTSPEEVRARWRTP